MTKRDAQKAEEKEAEENTTFLSQKKKDVEGGKSLIEEGVGRPHGEPRFEIRFSHPLIALQIVPMRSRHKKIAILSTKGNGACHHQ